MTVGRAKPVRTCVGCRERAAKADLLRVVAIEGELVPDPRGRRQGRGAYVHPSLGCLDLAKRRRAFARGLRVTGPLDTGMVRAYLEAPAAEQAAPGERAGKDDEHRAGSGSRLR